MENVMEKGEVARAASAWLIIGGLTWADLADIASFIASTLAAAYTLWLVIEKCQKKREADSNERT